MNPRFVVFFDACILYPAPLRDLFMQLAMTDLFQARWSNQVHEEWIRNLLVKRSELSREKLDHVRDLMNLHSMDSLVDGYEDLIQTIDLPDLDDRHVVAASIKGKADVIVTFNLKDFPTNVLFRFGMEAQHPDDFLLHLFDLDHELVLQSVKKIRLRLKNPPKTTHEYLDILSRQSIPAFVSLLGENQGFL